jgi:hypothetical protein
MVQFALGDAFVFLTLPQSMLHLLETGCFGKSLLLQKKHDTDGVLNEVSF